MFKSVIGKLGNMRKAVDWTVAPIAVGAKVVVIQSERRIARVDTETGKTLLSDGKGGHQGFAKLMPGMGNEWCIAPPEMVATLKKFAEETTGTLVVAVGKRD